MIRMQGTPNQSVAGSPTYVGRTGGIRILFDSAVEADVIVLEWKLPNILGIDLLAQLRHHGVKLPVVFLTSHVSCRRMKNSPSSAARLTSSTSHAVRRFWPAVSGSCRNLASLPPISRPTR